MVMVNSCDKVIQNTELLTSILLRLPAKDVTRCKCVSKQWQSLISAPWFCHSHTQSSANSSSLWVCNKHIISFTLHQSQSQSQSQVRTYLPFDAEEIVKFSLEGPFCVIMQSCNGLVLCKALYCGGTCEYLVHNPVTGKFLNLPDVGDDDDGDGDVGLDDIWYYFDQIAAVYLDFDPLKSFYFNVISFVKLPRRIDGVRRSFRVYVYSSETRSWNEGEVFFTASPGMKVDSGVYCNGAVHWYTPGEVSMYFDVHEQCFKALPKPTFRKGNDDSCIVKYFGEYKGNLHLVLTQGDSSLDFDVFKLKEDYSSWVVIYHVDLNLARDGFFTNIPSFHVVCLFLEGNEQDWRVVYLVGSNMVSYNLKDHTSRIVHEVSLGRVDEVRKSFHHYFETICNVP